MDPKGSNLASTDLLEISELVSGSYVTKSITGAEIIASIPPSTTAWGTITGTLSSQTDLNTALSGKVPTTRTLTINGTTQDLSADRTFTISTGITIGTTAITSGTVGRVLFEGTGNVVQESANLFWDNTNGRLGIGTSSPSAIVHSVGSVTASGAIARANYLNNILVASANSDVLVGLDITPTFTNGAFTGVTNIGQRINIPSTKTAQTITDGTGNVSLVYNRDATNSWVTMTTTGSAGLLYEFRHATRPGFNFLTPGAIGTGIGQDTTGFIISNTSNVYPGVPYFKLFNSSGNVVLQNGGTLVDAGFRLDVNGTARVSGQATIAGTTNASAGIGRNTLINGTITATANSQTLVGLDIEPTFNTGAFTGVEGLALRVTGFVSNFTSSGATQIRIIGPSGSNKSLFFFNSSTTFASTRIYNQGTNNNFVIATGDSLSNPTDRFTIFASTGNVAINTTTDAGFKLDVNGTARVSGLITATQNNIHATHVGANIKGLYIVNNADSVVRAGLQFDGSTAFVELVGRYNNGTPFFRQDGGNGNISFLRSGVEFGRIFGATGNFAINTTTDIASSKLTIESTTQGFLPPRMTTTQKNAIATPASGLMVYDTTLNVITYYNGTTWI